MKHPDEKRRHDDAETRSKADLTSELALNRELSEKSAAHLLHELQVHQAELEMQNQELRESQQALEESRDRYARLYDFSPVGYLTLSETGSVLKINLTGAAMLGKERASIIGKPLATFFNSSDVHAFFHHLRQVFHPSANVVSELRLLNPAAEPIYVRLESAPVLSKTRACLTVMTNITEQKRLSLALQKTRIEHEALLNTIPAIVFYKDMNLRYIAISRMFADFLGRPIGDVLGKTDFELLAHDQAEKIQYDSRAVLESGKPMSGLEREIKDARGNTVYLSTILAPFYNPAGKIGGLVGVCLDVTPLKNTATLNQELVQQNRALTQQLFSIQESERRHLARELHDELGQWLTAIHAEAQAIDSMLDKEHRIEASAKAISNSASQMHIVIRDMLRKLRPALLDELGLADSLRELVSQWKEHNPGIASELVLEGNLDGFGENVNITLYRIIQEALSNAANYSHADRVSVRLCHDSGEAPESDTVSLCVEDNGRGFDPEQVSKGLGLLGMRERAIAAGGSFSLSNTPGQGVRIDVRLPLHHQMERRKK
jgi:PAS domain S-box-containing protein